MDENDWTERLISGLSSLFKICEKDYSIHNTTKEGMYFESLQKKFTNIQHLAEIYIFHGSPDVMICKGDSVVA